MCGCRILVRDGFSVYVCPFFVCVFGRERREKERRERGEGRRRRVVLDLVDTGGLSCLDLTLLPFCTVIKNSSRRR